MFQRVLPQIKDTPLRNTHKCSESRNDVVTTDRTQNLPTVPTTFPFIFWFRTNLRPHVAFGCPFSLFPFHVEQFLSLFCVFLDLGSVQISRCLFTNVSHAWTQATHFDRKPTEMRLGSSLCISLGYRSVNLFNWDGSSVIYLVKVVSSRLAYCQLTISLSVLIGLLWEVHWYLIPHGTSTQP